MSIIVSRDGRDAVRLERKTIPREEYLQAYIYANPDSLPLHELKAELRLLILAREFPTGSGPIDALGVDAEGDLYVIETKLYKNPDKRLVLAQMLDYGASLWKTYTDPSTFFERLDTYVAAGAGMGLTARLQDFYGFDADAAAEHVAAVKRNVTTGTFRFVVLMDRLDERLKDLITYVNANSSFDIYGVELDFYQHGGLEIIIPNLYGAETKKTVSPSGGSRRKWDEASFFAEAEEKLFADGSAALRALYDWANGSSAELSWGTGANAGSFSVRYPQIHPRSVLSAYTTGILTLNFKWLMDTPAGSAFARRFGEELRQKAGLPLPNDYLNKYPNIQLNQWAPRVQEIITLLAGCLVEQSDASPGAA